MHVYQLLSLLDLMSIKDLLPITLQIGDENAQLED